MNVVMLSPGYPAEMAYFTRALAAVGATVIGVVANRFPEEGPSTFLLYEHFTRWATPDPSFGPPVPTVELCVNCRTPASTASAVTAMTRSSETPWAAS